MTDVSGRLKITLFGEKHDIQGSQWQIQKYCLTFVLYNILCLEPLCLHLKTSLQHTPIFHSVRKVTRGYDIYNCKVVESVQLHDILTATAPD